MTASLGGSSNEEIIDATIDILKQNPPPSGGGQGQNTVPKASHVGNSLLMASTSLNIKKHLANLEMQYCIHESLANVEENVITREGGIILAKSPPIAYHRDGRPMEGGEFHGIVALPKKNRNYFLVLCPGGGYADFSYDEIEELMKEAVNTILERRIQITAISDQIGRHPEHAHENFKKWQKKVLSSGS